MRVLMINSVCGIRSTGRICTDLAENFEAEGHEVKIAYGRENVPERYSKYAVRIGTNLDVRLSGIHSRLTDRHGFSNIRATKMFLEWADAYNPDMLWLHNIHGYYINIELLFNWIKQRKNMTVKWTLHDCWAFTGHCSYFSAAKCEKWKNKCEKCIQRNKYPKSLFKDSSKKNYEKKKELFTGVNNMSLVTPSRWLAELVNDSFLQEYNVIVKHNTVDEKVFKPTEGNFKERYSLQDKKIVLGVASVWDERKGLKDIIKLRKELDESFAIVVVGVTEKQIKQLPPEIIAIKRTNSASELAEIYTAADVFINPTYEDNYPTVNLEAKACGTPVLTYRTGGSVESVPNNCIVEVGNIQELAEKVKEIVSSCM